MDELAAAFDRRGAPVCCRGCRQWPMRRQDLRRKSRVCPRDRKAPRFERFLSGHPEFADGDRGLSYFEGPGLVAEYASVFRRPPPLDDRDPEVCRWVARRIASAQVAKLAADPDPVGEAGHGAFPGEPERIVRDLARSRLAAISQTPADGPRGRRFAICDNNSVWPEGTHSMKVMIRRSPEYGLSIYVPKKDLEEAIVESEHETLWGGWIRIANGWVLNLPDMAPDTQLPVTVNARKSGEEE